mgnify:CR=1 FL=1|jgi:hypothetical protein|tara:strand:- start:1523 stop:2098 length:576 start_codon:yes stop_codon:yes gene_type:complete
MSNTGYGIAGAVNVYTRKAKLGNWVEDEFGQDIVKHARPPKGSYVTDQMANHIDPQDMQAHPSMTQTKMMSIAEMKAKNKEGSSYSLLFDHQKQLTPDEKYATSYQSSFGRGPEVAAAMGRPKGDLEKERAKRMVREIRERYSMVPESVSASAYMTAPSEHTKPTILDRGQSQRLPQWSMKHTITAEHKGE